MQTTTIDTIIPCLEEIDCGAPIVGDGGVVTRPFNNTKFSAVITFHCEVRDIPQVVMAVCGSNGEWIPNPSSFHCQNGILGNFQKLYFMFSCIIIPSPSVSHQCGFPTVPVNGHINSNYSSTVEGSQITFHCGDDSPVMTSTCSNGRWIPNPADLDCGEVPPKGINS